WADIFLLPSVCEGSATVVYEALGAGLPVVCTPNTGSVVRDGVEGHVVPVSDAEAVSAAVERLVWDSELRTRMGQAAARRASEFSVQEYGKRLLRATGLGGLEE
ncbi:MAG: glycosyltransferase, partial [Lentisphaerae bacterium]|nr:glycosyltransferase [Lentisphaerota bacterium]